MAAACLVALLAACGRANDGADGPAATLPRGEQGRSTPTTTAPPEPATAASTATTAAARTPEQEVEQAYLRSWDVYAEAVRELDESGLADSYAGEAHGTVTDDVERYRSANTPVRVNVEHDYRVVAVSETSATVIDGYQNHSVLLDRSTGAPLEPDPNETIVDTYSLTNMDGTWKVTFIAR